MARNKARIVITEDATIFFRRLWHARRVLLRVTRGAIRDGAIRDAVVRAHAITGGGDGAELAFAFAGNVARPEPLASGELRRQLGLKLRAANTCNVIYVMWPVAGARLAVSVKRNPGARTHADCGARGYTDVAAAWAKPPPPLVIGARHVLVAELIGDELTAAIDGEMVWRGALPALARDLVGPIGLRTDNVMLDAIELAAR